MQSPHFQIFIALTIFGNAVWLALETDLADKNNRELFVHGELLFVIVFCVEICARLQFFGLRNFFFRNKSELFWNYFDFLIVVYAVVDIVLVGYLDLGGSGKNGSGAGSCGGGSSSSSSTGGTSSADGLMSGAAPTATGAVGSCDDGNGYIGTLLRLIKIGRLARLIRLLRFFKQVWLLIQGLSEALRFLGWVWILLVMIMYIFSIFMTKTLGQTYKSLDADFGTVGRSVRPTSPWMPIS